LYRINNLVKKHVTGAAPRRDPGDHPISQLPADTSTIVSHAVHQEIRSTVSAAIDELDPLDREVILLRGIEQNSNETVALLLGISPNAASMRWQRALQRLRARLPGSVFDDLAGE
jgi:RNA polymerase sigma factor (sigma-70 family)